MKADWIETCISDVAEVQSGSGFPDRYQGQVGCDIPFYKVSDMNIAGNEREMFNENNSITEEVRRELGAALFPKGSTIFPKIGGAIATNKKRLTTRPCCVDNNVMGVVPRVGKIDGEFLFYFFLKHDLSEFANEAHLPSIKKSVVEGWAISLPTSLLEQRRIVAILDEAFEGIATAKANAEKNLQNARELFESVLDESLTTHGEGAIETTLGAEVELLAGYAFPSGGYTDNSGDARLLRGDNIMQGYLRWEDAKRWPARDFEPYARFALREGDVVLAMDRPWVKAGLKRAQMSATDLPCLQVQRTARLRPKTRLREDFLFHLTGSRSFSQHLQEAQTGIGVPHISGKQIESFRFMLPSRETQARIAGNLDDLQAGTQRLSEVHEAKLAALDELKKSLLHQAFTGAL